MDTSSIGKTKAITSVQFWGTSNILTHFLSKKMFSDVELCKGFHSIIANYIGAPLYILFIYT